VLPAHVIAALYKARWQVELFFKWGVFRRIRGSDDGLTAA
jgi:IS4 transposase